MSEPNPRGPGRPRTKPPGTRTRRIDLTDAELALVKARADHANVSVAEWMRRVVLKAAAGGGRVR